MLTAPPFPCLAELFSEIGVREAVGSKLPSPVDGAPAALGVIALEINVGKLQALADAVHSDAAAAAAVPGHFIARYFR